MNIILSDIGKRFGKHWLFRNIEENFKEGDRVGIQGINGSGKSSFLQIVAGISLPTEGELKYIDSNGKSIDLNQLAGHLSIVSPYMDLPEQLTIKEVYHFQDCFLQFQEGIDLETLLSICNLKGKQDSSIHQFSSGMKQRLKLGLAFLSNSKVLLLDEPCSNLDQAGKSLYRELLYTYSSKRLIFIASNESESELINCSQFIKLDELKQQH